MIRLFEWEFEGCPADELDHCCFYEYALDSRVVRGAVLWCRQNRDRLSQPGDDIGNQIIRGSFGLACRSLVDHPEFPRQHWLEIDAALRQKRAQEAPPWPQMQLPKIQRLRYKGPQPAHLNRLKGEAIRWKNVEREKLSLLEALQKADKNARSLRRLSGSFRHYLRKGELTYWRRILSSSQNDTLRRAIGEFRLLCEKRIAELYRPKHELVVYEVDWTLRLEELKEHFGRWADTNRVHEPRKRGGGRQATTIELLKALGASRLLHYFRKHQRRLPQPYQAQGLYEALIDYTRDQRNAIDRLPKPLYESRSGWNRAEVLARRHLRSLLA